MKDEDKERTGGHQGELEQVEAQLANRLSELSVGHVFEAAGRPGVGEGALRGGAKVDPGQRQHPGGHSGAEQRQQQQQRDRGAVHKVDDRLQRGVLERVVEDGLDLGDPDAHELERRADDGQEADSVDDQRDGGGRHHQQAAQRPVDDQPAGLARVGGQQADEKADRHDDVGHVEQKGQLELQGERAGGIAGQEDHQRVHHRAEPEGAGGQIAGRGAVGDAVDEQQIERQVDQPVPVVDGRAVGRLQIALAVLEIEGQPVELPVDVEGQHQIDHARERKEREQRQKRVGRAGPPGQHQPQQHVGQQPDADAQHAGDHEQQLLVEFDVRSVHVAETPANRNASCHRQNQYNNAGQIRCPFLFWLVCHL